VEDTTVLSIILFITSSNSNILPKPYCFCIKTSLEIITWLQAAEPCGAGSAAAWHLAPLQVCALGPWKHEHPALARNKIPAFTALVTPLIDRCCPTSFAVANPNPYPSLQK